MPRGRPIKPKPLKHGEAGAYLSFRQTGDRLGITVRGVRSLALDRKIRVFEARGKRGRGGLRLYVAAAEIERLSQAASPRHPITIEQAANLLGVTVYTVHELALRGQLNKYKRLVGHGSGGRHLYFERNEVERLKRERQPVTPERIRAAALDPSGDRSKQIADVLSHRPKSVTDAEIARAFGVSRQRVAQIKHKVEQLTRWTK